MKFLHISDLHLGRRVNEFSMLEEQEYILNEILRIAGEQGVDGILAAGDIYDKAVPGAEAVQLLDAFVTRAARADIPLYLVSGNHDSAQRLAFGEELFRLARAGIYISPVYSGTVAPITREDAYGTLQIYLIPFIKPAAVRRFFPERAIETYQDAFAAVVEGLKLDPGVRNICVAHQLITGAVRSESEEISVGGIENIDASALREFDYAALGHIHRPQQIGKNVRYCGAPLKYSFSEAGDKKSVTIVELREKGDVSIDTVPLKALHDMREIRGSYEEVTLKRNYEGTDTSDFVHITLTDEEDIPNAMGRLRAIYPNLMKLTMDNRRTRAAQTADVPDVRQKTPMELFAEFYRLQNNQDMTPAQRQLLRQAMEEVWE